MATMVALALMMLVSSLLHQSAVYPTPICADNKSTQLLSEIAEKIGEYIDYRVAKAVDEKCRRNEDANNESKIPSEDEKRKMCDVTEIRTTTTERVEEQKIPSKEEQQTTTMEIKPPDEVEKEETVSTPIPTEKEVTTATLHDGDDFEKVKKETPPPATTTPDVKNVKTDEEQIAPVTTPRVAEEETTTPSGFDPAKILKWKNKKRKHPETDEDEIIVIEDDRPRAPPDEGTTTDPPDVGRCRCGVMTPLGKPGGPGSKLYVAEDPDTPDVQELYVPILRISRRKQSMQFTDYMKKLFSFASP